MTYSIVAHDARAGQMGIAVQSHHIAAGAHVIAAEAGVGLLAVQSYADRSYARDGLSLLRDGNPASDTLEALVEAHARTEKRAQLAVLDRDGRLANHTGALCVASCGHARSGDASAQANMVAGPEVWDAMLDRFEASEADLAGRLVDALDAAEEAGGDLRGQQSAGLMVVPVAGSDAGTVIDLRVDDHPDPLSELRRLDGLRRASEEMSRAFDLAAAGDVGAAVDLLDAIQGTYGANLEPTAWSAVLLARAGLTGEARSRLKAAIRSEPGWAELFRALPAAALLPDDPGLVNGVLDGEDE